MSGQFQSSWDIFFTFGDNYLGEYNSCKFVKLHPVFLQYSLRNNMFLSQAQLGSLGEKEDVNSIVILASQIKLFFFQVFL